MNEKINLKQLFIFSFRKNNFVSILQIIKFAKKERKELRERERAERNKRES